MYEKPIALWNDVATMCATWCCTTATRDSKTVSDRVEHEGFSFLTITLPSFCKDFEKSLSQGGIDDTSFAGFSRRGGTPEFLRGFLHLVFGSSSGLLLDNPNIEAIRSIRQLTLMFGKVKLMCSDERIASSFAGFVECESELKERDREFSLVSNDPSHPRVKNTRQFERIASLLFAEVFSKVDRDIAFGNILPKHGPGATADKLSSNGKLFRMHWTTRLERIFPARDYIIPNERFFETLDRVEFREPGNELPVKVIHVPKTLKTPRIIAIEPACMQYMQQGILESFREALEGSYLNGFIGVDSQVPNQELARLGSLNGTLATLDLSEASDRVSNQHVRSLLRNHPWFFRGVDACRSRKADVPGHGVIRLAKFASMGSALTFPMEAAVFLTAVFCGIERDLNKSLNRSIVKQYLGRVRIYGDDIIIPIDHVQSVMASLESFGFKVNTAKSFWNGKFRESCGKEYYDGHDVTVCRVRTMLPDNRQHAQQIIGTSDLRNRLYCAGHWKAASTLDKWLDRIISVRPNVELTSAALGRYSFLGYSKDRENSDLHRPEVRAYGVRAIIPADPVDDYGALLKYFLRRGDLPSPDESHLRRAGRPFDVGIKQGWHCPY